MRKHYFVFNDAKKKSRWLYSGRTNSWQKTKPVAYSDIFIDKFVRTIFYFSFLSFCLLGVFLNLPFAGVSFAFARGKIILGVAWILYFLIMLTLNRMIKSPFSFFIFGTAISSIMLIFSDVTLKKYNTEIYNFFLYASIICILYLLIIRHIKYITNRKVKPKKQLKDTMDVRNF